MIRVICTLFKFQSVLIPPDGFVYARIFWRRLLQILQSFRTATSVKLAVLLILFTTIMSGLLLITSWSVWSRNSTGFLLSYFQLLVLVGVGTMVCIFQYIHVLVAREHECIYRRYRDVPGILLVKDHCNLI